MASTVAGLIEWASRAGARSTRRSSPVRPRARPRCPAASPSGSASTSTSSVVAVEQLVGEVDAADAEVGDPHACRMAPARRAGRATSTPNPSSPKKMLPIPATSTLIGPRSIPPRSRRGGSRGSDPATPSASVAGSSSRVTAMCCSTVDVAEHAGDGGRLAGEEDVVGVGRADDQAAGRTFVPAATSTPAITTDVGPRVDRRVDAGVPPRRRLGLGTRQSAAIERIAPCSRAQTSGGRSSKRSTMAAAAGVGAPGLGLLLVGEGEHPQSRGSRRSRWRRRCRRLSGATAGWS